MQKQSNQNKPLLNSSQLSTQLIQNLILKQHFFKYSSFAKKSTNFMNCQLACADSKDFQMCKNSRNTCSSSTDNSPTTTEEKSCDEYSGVKSFKSHSTLKQSPMSCETPSKTFASISVSSLSSLQKRSYSQNIQKKEDIFEEENRNIDSKRLNMNGQSQTQIEEALSSSTTHSTLGQQKNGQIIIKEAILKQKQLSHENKIQSSKKQTSIEKRKSSTQSSQNHSQSTKRLDTRPVPLYKDARPILYVWLRSLCSQLTMCFDVFALSLKYLDEYHITYNNPYDRNTFTINAYGMVIIASKVMNKQILTPQMIAKKIKVTDEKLVQIEMNLIKMMNFKVYFETFAKMTQKKVEAWQQKLSQINRNKQLTMLDENINSFKRFYALMKCIEQKARHSQQITLQMVLNSFIYTYASEFKANHQINIFGDILSSVFSDLIEQKQQDFNREKILQMINNAVDIEKSIEQEETINKCFEKRNNKIIYPCYSIFLNSILDLKF